MRAYYLVAVVLAFIILAVFIYRDNDKKTNHYLNVLFIIVCLANLGYFALGVSRNLEEALLAKKITYLGGCFMPPVMAACMCALCNIKVKRWIKMVCVLFSAMVYTMVLTAGYFDFYYQSVSLVKVYDATALSVEHGVGYGFFYVILYGYMVVDIFITIVAYIKKQVTKRNLCLLIILQSATIIAFVVGRIVAPTFEVMPGVYVLNSFILMIIQTNIGKYNLYDSIYEAMEQNNTTGYIVLDSENRFIGCNDIAKNCISGLDECEVDTEISEEQDVGFLREWVRLYKESGNSASNQTLQYQDSYYECIIKSLTTGKKRTGFIIELQDCTDRKKYLDLLSNYNTQLKEQVEQQIKHINYIQQKTVLGMAAMVENRDNNTGGHIKRTSDVIEIFVDTIKEERLLDISEQFCEDLIKAAPMHDLGKIAIEDRILQKPGKFTDEEFEIMKTHTEKSAEIVEMILRGVEDNRFVNVAVNVARYHHEKWNGKGYPMGLAAEDIPLEARIMAIADVYDALVSKRCYKEAMDFSTAYDIIIESMGSHFDPGLEQVFVKSRDKLEAYYKNANDQG